MGPTVEDLVERSTALKSALVEFAWQGRVGRDLGNALVERFGNPIVAEEEQLTNAVDAFILTHRLSDGRTVLERFVRARGDLPRDDRDFMLGWLNGVEGCFEAQAIEGEALVAVNVVDELTYRIHSNMGVQLFHERIPPGSFMVGRVVPVQEEWLISGSVAVFPADEADRLLPLAAKAASTDPEILFRNPEKLRRGWEMQNEDRAGFIEFFGADLVVLPGRDLPDRWEAFWRFRHPDAAVPPGSLGDLPDAETVGLIYDEQDGLGFYADFGAFQEVFARPELVTQPRYADVVRVYLHDDTVSPVPLHRCAQQYPDGADIVFAHVLKRKRFSWERDGQALIRRFKADYLDRVPRPRFLPFGTRLTEFVRACHGVRVSRW